MADILKHLSIGEIAALLMAAAALVNSFFEGRKAGGDAAQSYAEAADKVASQNINLQERIEELEAWKRAQDKHVIELTEMLAAKDKRIEELEALTTHQEARIAELEAEVHKLRVRKKKGEC